MLRKTLVLPILRSYKLEGHLFGAKPCPAMFLQPTTTPFENVGEESNSAMMSKGASSSTTANSINPPYEAWITVDQLLLGWLYNSMPSEVVVQLMGFKNSKELW